MCYLIRSPPLAKDIQCDWSHMSAAHSSRANHVASPCLAIPPEAGGLLGEWLGKEEVLLELTSLTNARMALLTSDIWSMRHLGKLNSDVSTTAWSI